MSRDDSVFMAKLSEQAERYDEMVNYMKEVVKAGGELNVDERNLLSVAYKNVIGSRRASWRIISSIEQREETKGNAGHVAQIKTYRQKVEKELGDICNDIFSLLTDSLIPTSQSDESKVFFYKMKGDYHRYHAEVTAGDGQKNEAEASYAKAWELAQNSLRDTHPVRLGLALNYSVFFYEILKKPDEGCKLAKEAFDSAVEHLDQCDEAEYKESTLIMQLLRDNLTLWTEDMADGGKNEGDAAVEDM